MTAFTEMLRLVGGIYWDDLAEWSRWFFNLCFAYDVNKTGSTWLHARSLIVTNILISKAEISCRVRFTTDLKAAEMRDETSCDIPDSWQDNPLLGQWGTERERSRSPARWVNTPRKLKALGNSTISSIFRLVCLVSESICEVISIFQWSSWWPVSCGANGQWEWAIGGVFLRLVLVRPFRKLQGLIRVPRGCYDVLTFYYQHLGIKMNQHESSWRLRNKNESQSYLQRSTV